jgi:hypothetical protein
MPHGKRGGNKSRDGGGLAKHTIKERLLALVRDLFTFSSKVIKIFILV